MKSLLDLIEESGFSRYEVSEKMGISRSAMDSWIKGRTFPSKLNLSLLSVVLKVSSDEVKSCIPIIKKSKLSGILKELRIRGGLEQKEVAERLSLKPSTISNWERGKDVPPKKHYDAIGRLYNINVLDFLG